MSSATSSPIHSRSTRKRAQEHILKQEDGKKRLTDAVKQLSSAFALAVPHPEAIRVRDDVGFFQAVRSVLNKVAPHQERAEADLDHAIRQIASQAVASTEGLDIFEAAGLKKPDISILSDQFLSEVHDLPQKNLAVGAAEETATGRDQDARPPQCRPVAVVLGVAGEGNPKVSKPGS